MKKLSKLDYAIIVLDCIGYCSYGISEYLLNNVKEMLKNE